MLTYSLNSLESETSPEITIDKTLAIFKSDARKKEVSLVDILTKACITVTNVGKFCYLIIYAINREDSLNYPQNKQWNFIVIGKMRMILQN